MQRLSHTAQSASLAAARVGPRPPTHWLEQVDEAAVPDTARLPASVDLAVVGGGIIGVAAAYHLALLGAETLLLEGRALGWGASGRNAGLVLGAPATLEELHAVLEREGIDAGYAETGHLALASSATALERMRREVEARPADAAPVRVVERRECEALLGMAIAARFAGGRWMPRAAAVHPARLLYGLAAAAARRGAAFASRAPVLGVRRARGDAGWEVRTERGTVRARQVVLACGARTGRLCPALAPLLKPARGQALATRPLPPLFRVAMAVDYGDVYWRQAPDGVVVLGGLRQLDPTAEDTAREAANPRIQQALAAFLPSAFPGIPRVRVARRWAGIMDATPDGRPLVGAVPGAAGLWVAAGFGGHGLPPALRAGRALARAAAEGGRPEGLESLDPARFARRPA
jgi:glycine/D-amino acid oxidase-like deaminating enzyme